MDGQWYKHMDGQGGEDMDGTTTWTGGDDMDGQRDEGTSGQGEKNMDG